MPTRRELLQAGVALALLPGCRPPYDEAAFRRLSAALTGHPDLDGDVLLTWFDLTKQVYGEERMAALAERVDGASTPDEAATRVPTELAPAAEAIVLAWYTGELPLPDGRAATRMDATLAWSAVPYTHRWATGGGPWSERPA